MMEMEFRAYDNQARTMVYNKDSWLPKGLKIFGLNQHPVLISDQGIHYTLDCLTNQYEDEWEKDVVTIHDIEIMPFTNSWDLGEIRKKIYENDIIAFSLTKNAKDMSARKIGKIQFSEEYGTWIVVDKEEHFIEKLGGANQPIVLGNWFDNRELLN